MNSEVLYRINVPQSTAKFIENTYTGVFLLDVKNFLHKRAQSLVFYRELFQNTFFTERL